MFIEQHNDLSHRLEDAVPLDLAVAHQHASDLRALTPLERFRVGARDVWGGTYLHDVSMRDWEDST